MEPARPPRVRPGDTVAVVSPSFGALGAFPHRAETGRRYLESLALRVRVMPHAARTDGWASAPAKDRAADLHEAFLDDEVSVVLAAIGGNHSNQLLPHLDFDLLRAHPKVFQGYSDMTVLHWALLKHAGLSTFYGPALVSELGEHPAVLPFTDRFLRAAWFGGEAIGFEPAAAWTDEFLDWNLKADLERPRELRPGSGWVVVREGAADGWLLGGCLESICWHLKGSASWIDPTGAILFLETSEEAPSPAHVDAYLTDLEQLGVFAAAAALVVARPYGYDDARTARLWKVVRERTEASGIPVLANVDLGHTDPKLTVPLGARARLNTAGPTFALLESPTA
jgi:muramoyltetrapeptide carboxypeptidase